mmetsp:Transcript_28296/g.71582  ORF Transcript_28296/g.71582 Transcript_28296/m.71582 type:complete len:94 (-) Transcript_28296:134-415(-)
MKHHEQRRQSCGVPSRHEVLSVAGSVARLSSRSDAVQQQRGGGGYFKSDATQSAALFFTVGVARFPSLRTGFGFCRGSRRAARRKEVDRHGAE